jgi:hypothetical protein
LDQLGTNALFSKGTTPFASAASIELVHPAKTGWWRLGVEQPLRVESGQLTFDLINPFTDWNKAPEWSSRQISLVPSGREVRTSLTRDWYIGKAQADNLWLRASLAHTIEPGHIADAPSDTTLHLSASKRF